MKSTNMAMFQDWSQSTQYPANQVLVTIHITVLLTASINEKDAF